VAELSSISQGELVAFAREVVGAGPQVRRLAVMVQGSAERTRVAEAGSPGEAGPSTPQASGGTAQAEAEAAGGAAAAAAAAPAAAAGHTAVDPADMQPYKRRCRAYPTPVSRHQASSPAAAAGVAAAAAAAAKL